MDGSIYINLLYTLLSTLVSVLLSWLLLSVCKSVFALSIVHYLKTATS